MVPASPIASWTLLKRSNIVDGFFEARKALQVAVI